MDSIAFIWKIIKILFNVEYLVFYSFLKAITKERKSIEKMFLFIGEIDAAISTASLKAGNLKTMVFGGEGMFLASLQGTGKVWLQSMPFSRLSKKILSGISTHKGEGSLLGNVADVFQKI